MKKRLRKSNYENNILKTIGRIHSYEDFLNTYKLARNQGFGNINVDLMIGLPNQKISDIKSSLEEITELKPEHISVYSLIVEDTTRCDYAIKIIKDIYNYFINPKETLSDKLFNILKFKITTISDSITFHNTNKGLMFKDRRNFVLLSKTNYGVYVRILKVENQDNILNIVTRKNYEPLCLSYKVKEESEIDVILPYINSSYDLNKINPYDLKEEFYKYYLTTWFDNFF